MKPVALAFSHVGIFVRDAESMTRFYQRVLGLVVTDRGHLPGRELVFMSRDPREHHQVVFASGRTGDPDDKVINQISFRVGSLEELQAMHEGIKAEPGASDLRAGQSRQRMDAVLSRPEGNRLELFVDTPWYIAQPCAEPLELDQAADVIRTETEAMCRSDPSFAPAEVWRADLARRIAAATKIRGQAPAEFEH
jgi:catechol 2,3-dioxygenase-like lactoylglutathione lyase family enzyme